MKFLLLFLNTLIFTYSQSQGVFNEIELADSLSRYGNRLINDGEYKIALATLKASLKLNESSTRAWHIARDYNDIGTVYHYLRQYDSAVWFYQGANDKLTALEDTTILPMTLTNLGILYKRQGKYQLALESLFESLRFNPSSRTEASSYNTIGSTYSKMGEFDQALKYYHQSLKAYEETNNQRGRGIVFNNLGNVYNDINVPDSAIKYFEKSLKVKEVRNDRSGISKALNNLGLSYIKKEDFKKARNYLSESLQTKKELKDSLGIANTLNLIASIDLKTGKPKLAKENLDLASDIIQKEGVLNELRENLFYKSEYFRLIKNWKQQANILEQYIIINDSLLDQEKAKALAEIQIRFDSESKDQEISYLKSIEELQKAELLYQEKTVRITSMAAIALLVLLAFIIGLYYNNRRKKEKIEHLNQEMQHRIKNNLQILSSILKLQTGDLKNSEAREALKVEESRVNAMALVHQLLYSNQDKKQINVKKYISELCQYLERSFIMSNNSIEIERDVEDIMIDVDQMMSIGLIINELITNSIKHAFKEISLPYIKIRLKELESRKLFLEVADNGNGIPEVDMKKKSDSFGMRLVEILTKQINGEQSFFNKNGAVFQFSIPQK